MKKFMVYVDDETMDTCMKIAVPAKNEKAARDYVQGNGSVIAVKDITEDCPIDIECVSRALTAAGFGRIEKDLICRALMFNDICSGGAY